jgi:hypothetical protein
MHKWKYHEKHDIRDHSKNINTTSDNSELSNYPISDDLVITDNDSSLTSDNVVHETINDGLESITGK